MSSSALSAFQENASRLGMRLQESLSEHTRDLAITRPTGASYFDMAEDKVKNIRRQLDSTHDREKLDALKRLVAMISKGRNVAEYFAQVVKNVASPNLEIRKLVYIYLLRYAEVEPDLALLSINTFQKDLTDPNPLIRAMALRVLSGIKVPMIASLVSLGIKKCAADPNPYVRKAAALAIPKLYSLDPSQLNTIQPILLTLLRDRSPVSVGCVAVAFNAVFPDRLDLLHSHYRHLCRLLVDADEWGQASLMDLLLRYARRMLPKPTDAKGLGNISSIDPDVQLLLSSAEPLLQSRNPAVVLSACRVHYSISPSLLPKIVSPLLRLTHAAPSPQVERVSLAYLSIIAVESPDVLAPHYTRFFVRSSDLPQIKHTKTQILSSLVGAENVREIIREFTDYASDTDDYLVASSIHAIGRCARLMPDVTSQALNVLLSFIENEQDVVVSNAVLVLKSLIQSQLSSKTSSSVPSSSKSPLQIIVRLARRLDEVGHPSARACIFWLVGQYAGWADPSSAPAPGAIEGIADWAPDVLRKGAKAFREEASIVKLQTVTLAAKLLVLNPAHRTLGLLSRYVFSLARYDLDYDVRDRARMLSALFAGVAPSLRTGDVDDREEEGYVLGGQAGVILRREQVKVVLFEGKTEVTESGHTPVDSDFLGSLGLILGKDFPGNRQLPDWMEEGTDSTLRDTEDDTPPVQTYIPSIPGGTLLAQASSPITNIPGRHSPFGSAPARGKWKDLDEFYADDSDEGESEESEEIQNDGTQQQTSQLNVDTTWSDKREEEEEDEEDEESEEESEGEVEEEDPRVTGHANSVW